MIVRQPLVLIRMSLVLVATALAVIVVSPRMISFTTVCVSLIAGIAVIVVVVVISLMPLSLLRFCPMQSSVKNMLGQVPG